MDRRVPLPPKLLLVLLLAYVFAPVDLLPDFLVGLGQIDDLVVIFIGLRAFVRLCPREVVHEHVHAIASGR
ncbi:MAG: YkvA family protein [Candidatus Binatia bacterium]